MIKDYLNSVVEDKSSKDFIIFSSILFSLGFIMSIISNAFSSSMMLRLRFSSVLQTQCFL